MGDFQSFLLAVLKQWISYMSGPVSILMYLWSRKKAKEIPGKWYFRICIFFLFVGCFAAWQSEHKALQEEQKKNLPALVGRIENVFTMDAIPIGEKNTQSIEFVELSVRNLGMPSMVESYHLRYNGEERTFVPTRVGKEMTLKDPKSGLTLTFHESDAMYEKTVSPILTGAMVRGWLFYILDGVNFDALGETSRRQCIVSFTDVADKEYFVTNVAYSSTAGPPPTFPPGVEYPIQNSQKIE